MDGYSVGGKLLTDKKGISYYNFKTYCVSCYDEEFGAKERAYYQTIKAAVENSNKKSDDTSNSKKT